MTMEAQIQGLIDKANQRMSEDEKVRKEVENLVKTFNIDLGEEKYSFKLENAVISDFRCEMLPAADVVLTSTPETLTKLIDGDMRPMRAYVTKKIKIQGKINDLMVLKKFF
ncbi:SCP-2 sterol transfer family [Thermoplasmatales archaeon BRNA1]|nr:SCP-2 sterol transfer family [Thermoplasmatales archaeon BRNA1]